MDNAAIIRILRETAGLLEIKQANRFRIRAYRNAIHTLEGQTVPLARRVAAGEDLTQLDGIGKELAKHIVELVETGELERHRELLATYPRGLLRVKEVPGVGPRKAERLWRELGVAGLGDLESAAKAGKIAPLSGFGLTSQDKILRALIRSRQHRGRFRLADADLIVEPLLAHLRRFPGVGRLEAAGSLRRRRETVGDLDLLATCEGDGGALIRHFTSFPQVEAVTMAGETRASVLLASGLQVDLRVVPEASYGAALVYFTGSKEHNVHLRRRAVERGLKISEYGVFREGDESALGGAREDEIYRAVGLDWIPPELREDRGELRAAGAGGLPTPLRREQLRGDLHMHSTWSDGKVTLEEMVIACKARGHQYMAIADHSPALAMVGGLNAERLRQQWREIEEIAERHPEIRILRALEVDILADGSLDMDDESLAQLDLVVASVHSHFDLPRDQQTKRLVTALEHPAVSILGHPLGRSIPKRGPIDIDVDALLETARDQRVAVEINCRPRRLDLPDIHLMRARELGVPIVINTDAHRPEHLDLLSYGIEQARRAWIEPEMVLNTLPVDELLARLASQRTA
ncbi:MAG: DNA polymerase/3'-5' exonuclease PolX [Acidobacteriota bacterium]